MVNNRQFHANLTETPGEHCLSERAVLHTAVHAKWIQNHNKYYKVTDSSQPYSMNESQIELHSPAICFLLFCLFSLLNLILSTCIDSCRYTKLCNN